MLLVLTKTLPASFLLPLSFCHYSYYVIINYIVTSNDTKIQYILPSLIAVSKFMTDEVIQMRTLPVTNNATGHQHEITLKLGRQSTEAYLPYWLCLFFYFLILCEKQCPIKNSCC